MQTVIIHRCYDDMQAELIKELLEQNEIACQVVSDVPHSVFPITMDGLGEIRIAVLEEEAARAQELIKEFFDAPANSFSESDFDE
jgi:hypothetical protein